MTDAQDPTPSLAELRAMLKAATPGPWLLETSAGGYMPSIILAAYDEQRSRADTAEAERDAARGELARTLAVNSDICAEVDRLRKELGWHEEEPE